VTITIRYENISQSDYAGMRELFSIVMRKVIFALTLKATSGQILNIIL
jgi:hypothetical protein